jgi:hypothetical protein
VIVLGPFAALRWCFTVECDSAALAGQVERALGSLLVPASEQRTARYRLVAPGSGPGRLDVDDQPLLESSSEWELYARLLWHVNVGAVDATRDHVLLHAAAAERAGRAIVLCAPMESGKTTLVAGLVRAGLAYVTDEAVAVRPSDGGITPFPKALSVDSGSWRTLADLEPRIPAEAAHLRAVQWQVPPQQIRPDAVSTGAVPAVLVFPRYQPRSPTTLTPMSPGAALLDLLGLTFRLDRQRARDMAVLAGVAERCTAVRLSVRSLHDAVPALLDLL